MRRAIVVSAAVVGVMAFGGITGYVAARLTAPNDNTASFSTDLGPPPVELPRKIPVPNDQPPLVAAKLDYRTESFTVRTKPNAPVRVRLRVPRGWDLRAYEREPEMVRFVAPSEERALRVESGFTPEWSPHDAMLDLVDKLVRSQPYENDLRIRSQRDGSVVGTDGETRAISTLIYTYIPNETVRYVMVRWVATEGSNATVEMSATGLPQDAKALTALLEEATRSVRRTD